jgi:hypothetical protein
MVKQEVIEKWGHRKLDPVVRCPYCEKGEVHVRTYIPEYHEDSVDFAVCDNPECNVEWFAWETEKTRAERKAV